MELVFELVMAIFVLCNLYVYTEDLLNTCLLRVLTITHNPTWELTSANTQPYY